MILSVFQGIYYYLDELTDVYVQKTKILNQLSEKQIKR